MKACERELGTKVRMGSRAISGSFSILARFLNLYIPHEAIDFWYSHVFTNIFPSEMVTDRFQTPLLSVRLERFALFLCSLPLLSFMSCVAIALVWHFDETTNTHCNVSILSLLCKRDFLSH